MPRINPINLNEADGKSKTLLENVEKALGFAPNLMRTLAHSPAALDAGCFGKMNIILKGLISLKRGFR